MDPDIKDMCIFLKSPRYTIWTSHIYYSLSPLVTIKLLNISFVVVQSLMNCSTPGFLILHYLLEFGQIHVHWVNDPIQPPHPLSSPSLTLNLTSVRIFSNEYSGLISFRMDWFDLLAVQGTFRSLLQHHSLRASILWCSAQHYGPTFTSIHDYSKNFIPELQLYRPL